MGYIDYSEPNYRYGSWGEDDWDDDFDHAFVTDWNTGRRLRRWHEALYLKLTTEERYGPIGVGFSKNSGTEDSCACFSPEESLDRAMAYLATLEREDIIIEDPVYFRRLEDGEEGHSFDLWEHVGREPGLGRIMEGYTHRLIKVKYTLVMAPCSTLTLERPRRNVSSKTS